MPDNSLYARPPAHDIPKWTPERRRTVSQYAETVFTNSRERMESAYVPQVEKPFSANFGQVHVSW